MYVSQYSTQWWKQNTLSWINLFFYTQDLTFVHQWFHKLYQDRNESEVPGREMGRKSQMWEVTQTSAVRIIRLLT